MIYLPPMQKLTREQHWPESTQHAFINYFSCLCSRKSAETQARPSQEGSDRGEKDCMHIRLVNTIWLAQCKVKCFDEKQCVLPNWRIKMTTLRPTTRSGYMRSVFNYMRSVFNYILDLFARHIKLLKLVKEQNVTFN